MLYFVELCQVINVTSYSDPVVRSSSMISEFLRRPSLVEIWTEKFTEDDDVEDDETTEEPDEHAKSELFPPSHSHIRSLHPPQISQTNARYPPSQTPNHGNPNPPSPTSRNLLNRFPFPFLRFPILVQNSLLVASRSWNRRESSW